MSRAKQPYLPHIDGLRALAVLGVITYHLNAALLPGGFIGVDIFFVISGFVVSRSTSALQAPNFPALLAAFYAHRAARIVPALIACLLATFLLACLFIPESWLSGSNEKTGLQAFLGLSNMVLARSENDYFAPKAGFNPFTHSWSLGVEEQFYLIFPWLFAVGLWGKHHASKMLFLAGLLASVAYAFQVSRTSESDAFYLLASRFWELALGVNVLQSLSASALLPARARRIGAGSSLALLAVSLLVTTPQTTPFPGSFLPCAGTAGLLACLNAESGDSIVARLLGWPPLRHIGRISYSLYLWHWPIFVLFRWTIGLDGFGVCTLALLLVFAAAEASHAWIETPFRSAFARTRLPNHLVLGYGIAALLAAYGVAEGVLSQRSLISLSTVSRHRQDWYEDMPRLDAAFPGCTADLVALPLPAGSAWIAQRRGCPPPAASPATLFVLGDSHATAYTVMLRNVVRQTGATLYLYSVGGCSFFGLPAKDSQNCAGFQAAAIADISHRLKSGDVIFLPSLRIPRLVQEYAYRGPQAAFAMISDPATIASRQANAATILPILKAWSNKGAEIVFEAPTPNFAAPPFRCADWFDSANPICRGGPSVPRATILALRAPVMADFSVFMQISHVHVWDPLPVLCPGDTCNSFRDGRPLFFDGDHLSGYGNRFLLPGFLAEIKGKEFFFGKKNQKTFVPFGVERPTSSRPRTP